jgi:hypothetical protein
MYGLAGSSGDKPQVCEDLIQKSKSSEHEAELDMVHQLLDRLSRNVLHALTSILPKDNGPTFTLPSTVAGRFVQEYFQWISTSGTEF